MNEKLLVLKGRLEVPEAPPPGSRFGLWFRLGGPKDLQIIFGDSIGAISYLEMHEQWMMLELICHEALDLGCVRAFLATPRPAPTPITSRPKAGSIRPKAQPIEDLLKDIGL